MCLLSNTLVLFANLRSARPKPALILSASLITQVRTMCDLFGKSPPVNAPRPPSRGGDAYRARPKAAAVRAPMGARWVTGARRHTAMGF